VPETYTIGVTILRLALALVAAFGAGAVNAIAGGGTLLTFPAIVALGVTPLVANATSTVALWPGALGSMWGYRGELVGARRWVIGFAAPSVGGGAVGAWLLLHTAPAAFDRIVPFLVLGATALFLVQRPLMRRLNASRPVAEGPSATFLAAQFLVAVYGGYFGAGIGILMLTALGFMGLTNLHRMNGLKNWGGTCINGTAVVMFAVGGIVHWPIALTMAAGGVIGGYAGARLAQRVGQEPVRRAIVAIGLAAFFWLLYHQ